MAALSEPVFLLHVNPLASQRYLQSHLPYPLTVQQLLHLHLHLRLHSLKILIQTHFRLILVGLGIDGK
ncbi:hypothetical protein CCACVL1_30973 [Corchorus capsularis]|uniref:Uncharacterized protein n=1 Tax=Corchorus capsularis TaxID=210143 RepID=A0A1R3FUG6_COCAP|nr:hypothetical protein CCACVL1_30973 [Corchorus capsularis]